MKEILKKFNNVFVYDLLYRLAFVAHNAMDNYFYRKSAKIDPIKNYNDFVALVKEMKAKGLAPGKRFLGCENLYYGHYHALTEYANYVPKYKTIGMRIVHGVDFCETPLSVGRMYNTFFFITQGNKSKLKDSKESAMQLDIGPFIHYASEIYDEEEENELKKEWGRTVLIYPTHTYEGSEIDARETDRYKRMIDYYANWFDTVLFCVYWHDVSDEVFRDISTIPKVKLVSCGLRSDEKFLSRTKTLMKVADLVVGTHVGTFIGYAIYMNKQIEYYELDENVCEHIEMTNREAVTEKRNKEYIKNVLLKNEDLKKIYNEYWGGEDKICTREEIAAALELRDEVIKDSLGFANRFDKSIRDLREKYKGVMDSKSQFKYSVLEGYNGEFF